MSSSFETSAADLVAIACQANGLAGDGDLDLSEAPPVSLSFLADKVARLAPRMPTKDRAAFLAAFASVWPQIDGPGNARPRYDYASESITDEESILMRWIGAISARRIPVASASRRLIAEGDVVAYPEEYEAMKKHPSAYGDYRLTGLRDDWFKPLELTHRQLALHVEFAPLLAAVLLASRLPGSLINGMLMPAPGLRPQVMSLLEVLLARRPDNMTDERFLPCVQWLLRPRPPLWPDLDQHIIG